MNAIGRCNIPRRVQILPESKERMRPTIKRWIGEGRKVRFSFSGEGKIIATEAGGWLVIESEPSDIRIETWYKRGTPTQKQTLRALEALLYWANFDQYPPKSELLHDIHEEIIAQTGIYKESPVTGKPVRVSTSSPLCTTGDMNRFVDTAISFLLDADVPPTLIDPISEKDFVGLYREWYKQRSIDPESIDNIKNWEEYCARFPYDEFNCIAVNELGTGQTQKIHIVSVGAETGARDEAWNWIRGATSIHTKIHQLGWPAVLQEYPHLIPKVERARDMAGKKEIEL
jgi:hypothetical protein